MNNAPAAKRRKKGSQTDEQMRVVFNPANRDRNAFEAFYNAAKVGV
jgi:hypothetical protein